ncbi:MAG: hypothetical protein M3Z27_04530 [Actinomycetota bacterium]|nr:hypothetical protein [Actinomycetota bacterium]
MLRQLNRDEAAALLRDKAAWRGAVLLLAAAAFIVRMVIIAHTHGGEDLKLYTYFSRLALHGVNPFASPRGGTFPPIDGNNPPTEVAAFSALLGIHNSPTTLRVLFAAADSAVIWLIGWYYPRPKRWKVAFLTFYAVNPFVLLSWTVYAEDKTILFLGVVAWLLALERARDWYAWAAAAALAVFKFLGVFALPAMAYHSVKKDRLRAVWPIAATSVAFLASNLPWFPDSLDAFSRRNLRLDIVPPFHASPTLLLSRLGLYTPLEAKLFPVLATVVILFMLSRQRIDIRHAVAWSLLAGYIFLPDDAFNRLLLITLPFMLISSFSVRVWLAVWLVSLIAALAALVATRGVPHVLVPIGSLLAGLFGHEGTLRHVLWMNILPVLVILSHVSGRRRVAPRAS